MTAQRSSLVCALAIRACMARVCESQMVARNPISPQNRLLDMQPNGCIYYSPMTREESTGLDAVFHALADSTRRKILEELAKRDEQTLFEICGRLVQVHGLSMKRQSISKHLSVLEDAGLIETKWQGRTKLHTSKLSSALPQITRWLKKNN